MYLKTQRSNKGTKAVGVVAAVAFTAGMGVLFTSMNFNAERAKVNSMELVILSPPPPPPPIEIPKPKIEVVEETPAPPEAPPIVAPEIEFVPEEPPVIVAPVADPVPTPEPVMVAPSPPTPDTMPRLIAGDKPEYPTAARRAGEQGVTQLDVCVNAAGRVTSVSVAGSSGSQRLDDAAAKWLRSERFTPAKINGVASAVCGHHVQYQWSLRDA